MSHLLVGKILEGAHNVKKDGAAYVIPEEVDATIFIQMGNEVLQVAKLARVETANDVLQIATQKGELFYFPPEHVVGLRLGGEIKASRTSAGFR